MSYSIRNPIAEIAMEVALSAIAFVVMSYVLAKDYRDENPGASVLDAVCYPYRRTYELILGTYKSLSNREQED